MIKWFVLVILLICASFGSSFDKAQQQMHDGNIKEALKLYKIAASREDEDALFKLGVFYYKGKYVKKSLAKAFNYFEKSAKLGHSKAKYNLALLYSRNDTPFKNLRKGYNLFLELAQHDHAKAQNKVGIFLTYGLGIEKDYKLAVRWYEQSLKNGYKIASCSLAYMYANGMGVFPNFGKARELAQEGYENNIPLCVKVYKDFNLHKYDKDRGFKFGFYK